MALKSFVPVAPVFNATVSGTSAVKSSQFNLSSMADPLVGYLINVGSGLTATFKIMVSLDNINYYDSGQILPSVSGSALIFTAEYSGAFPYVLVQITPSSGSGTVVITGCAKGVA